MTKHLLTPIAILTIKLSLPSEATAEMSFPEYEKQPKQAQASWGYKITRNEGKNPSFSVVIPPKAAAKCTGARLTIRNKKNRLLAQFDITPTKHRDGSLTYVVALFEELDGKAELIIYSDLLPDAALMDNFGGFSFRAATKLK